MSKPRIRPVVWRPPRPPARTRHDPFPPATLIPLPATGPEDVVVDGKGRLLTGVDDGRVLSVTPDGRDIRTVADTGGRPLGLHVMGDGRVIVCDAEQGLLRLDPGTGALETLHPMRFAGNAVTDSEDTVYFTQSSRRFGLAHWQGDILEHSGTGRLLRRSRDGRVDTLLEGLQFANGVVLTPDESAVVVAETGSYRLTRLWLTGPRAGRRDVMADNLPGSPDNMAVAPDGTIWVALADPREPLLDLALRSPPVLRKAVWALPERLRPGPRRTTRLVNVDTGGRIAGDLRGRIHGFHMATGVVPHDDRLYVGSLVSRTIAVLDLTAPGTDTTGT
jgi:sugar lactone lactonase YvrE